MVNKKDGNEIEDEYSDQEGDDSSNNGNSKKHLKEQDGKGYREITHQQITDPRNANLNNEMDYEGDSIMK